MLLYILYMYTHVCVAEPFFLKLHNAQISRTSPFIPIPHVTHVTLLGLDFHLLHPPYWKHSNTASPTPD